MIPHLSLSQCGVPTHHVSTIVHQYPMYKMWFLPIFKPYFHHQNVRRFQIHLDRWVLITVKPINLKVNSPLKSAMLFQYLISVFPTVFNDCCLLLHWLNTSSLGNAWWTGLTASSEQKITFMTNKMKKEKKIYQNGVFFSLYWST